MDLFFGFFNAIVGILMILKGFKIFKSSKTKDEDELAKEALWFSKWGTFFQIGGIIMVLFGLLQIMDNI